MEEKGRTMITGGFGLGLFGPTMAVSWPLLGFVLWVAGTPISIVFVGCALFGPRLPPSCQKSFFGPKKLNTDN